MPAPLAIDFPIHLLNGVRSSSFRLQTVNLTSRGMFTGNQIVDGPLYQLWRASFDFPEFKREQWQELDAILARAFETKTPFKIFDPIRQRPIGSFGNTGTGAGTPFGDDTTFGDGTIWDDTYYDGLAVAENAPAGRDSILLDGAVANSARVVVMGDVFAINGFLYEAINTTGADSLGRLRVNVRPRLREAKVIGDPVKAGRATGSFFVEAGDIIITRNSFTRRAPTSISFIEALP